MNMHMRGACKGSGPLSSVLKSGSSHTDIKGTVGQPIEAARFFFKFNSSESQAYFHDYDAGERYKSQLKSIESK